MFFKCQFFNKNHNTYKETEKHGSSKDSSIDFSINHEGIWGLDLLDKDSKITVLHMLKEVEGNEKRTKGNLKNIDI